MNKYWMCKKIGEVIAPKSDIRKAGNCFSNDEIIEYIDISSINNKTNRIEATTAISFKDAPSRAQQKVSNGDILVSLVRPNLKNVAIIDSDKKNLVASSGFAVLRATDINTKYLFRYICSPRFTNYLSGLTTGANYPAVRELDIKSAIIPIPAPEEQQRIVDELDLLNGILEKKKEQIKTLDKLIESIFYEMFGDPVSNEKGWPINLFGSICNSELGKMLDAKRAKGTNKPYLCTINVLWDKIDLSTVKEMPFEDGELERYSIKKGDLLICEGGDTGRAAIWDRDETVYYQNSIHRVRLDEEKMLPQVVLYIMKIYKQQGILNSFSSGQTIKHLVKKSLLSIPVPTPPIDKQRVFAQKLDKIKSSQQLIEQSICDTQQLLASRMDKYFSE